MDGQKSSKSSTEDDDKAESVKQAHKQVFDAITQLIDVVEEAVLLEKVCLYFLPQRCYLVAFSRRGFMGRDSRGTLFGQRLWFPGLFINYTASRLHRSTLQNRSS